MDTQSIFFFSGLAVALAVSAFILFGPSRVPRKRKGQVVGLVNLGSTCFLNTLLQALSSCAFFVEWIGQQKQDQESLTASLNSVLWILNGKGTGELHAPVDVLNALKAKGWVVPSGEQDAHELFHVIISTLQEENKKLSKTGSISDALLAGDTLSETSDIIQDCPDSLSDELETKSRRNTSTTTQDHGRGDLSVYSDANSDVEQSTEFYSVLDQTKDCGDCVEEHVDDENDDNTLRCDYSNSGGGCYDRAAGSCSLLNQQQHETLPFQGLLTSTLQCSVCGRHSSVRYDTFDSLSLPLVDQFKIKLEDLLRRFVKTEIIPDVDCEKCQTRTVVFKTLNFGKLPVCLCLHVSRTTWQSHSSTPAKRDDLIDYPEYLTMDDYVRLSPSSATPADVSKRKHVYRLKSVVVHVGGANSGHFLTYRRGPLDTNNRHRLGNLRSACMDNERWFLTSDDQVQPTTMFQAMNSPAYLLFYEKCSLEENN